MRAGDSEAERAGVAGDDDCDGAEVELRDTKLGAEVELREYEALQRERDSQPGRSMLPEGAAEKRSHHSQVNYGCNVKRRRSISMQTSAASAGGGLSDVVPPAKRRLGFVGGAAYYDVHRSMGTKLGPVTISEYAEMGKDIVKRIFDESGDGLGVARKNRLFALLGSGLVLTELFAGRQGWSVGMRVSLSDLEDIGLKGEGFLLWRSAEKSARKRALIEDRGNEKSVDGILVVIREDPMKNQ